MDNVHVEKAQDVETLEALLGFLAPARIDRVNLAAKEGRIITSDEGYSIPSSRTTLPLPPLPIKLLIIDSIAAPFRTAHDNDSNGFIARAKDFGMVGDKLKKLANVYGLAIVVVNQVSAVFDNASNAPSASHYVPLDLELNNEQLQANHLTTPTISRANSKTDQQQSNSSKRPQLKMSIPAHIQYKLPSYLYSRYQQPNFTGQSYRRQQHDNQAALGHTWTNIINTRIMLSRTERSYDHIFEVTSGLDGNESLESDDLGSVLGGSERGRRRRMELIFSPSAARGGIDYVLEESGLRSLGEPEWRELRDL